MVRRCHRPENGVTNLRGFDNRAETLSLSNVALGVTGERGAVKDHATFQAGLTPNTYTLAETVHLYLKSSGDGSL